MTAKHAGLPRIADQALVDQARAAAAEMRATLATPLPDGPGAAIERHRWMARWAGRALSLLEQVGEI